MKTGDKLRFRLGNIEGSAVGFRGCAYEVDKTCDGLQKDEPHPVLRVHNVGETQGVDHEHHAHDREEQRDFIGHVLCYRPDRAEQGILVVRGPSGRQDRQDREGSCRG